MTGKIIAVYSPKGGQGVSCVASHLSLVLAKKSSNTAVMDLVAECGTVAQFMQFTPRLHLGNLNTTDFHPNSSSLRQVAHPKQNNLSVLRYPEERFEKVDASKFIPVCRNYFDFTVIDLPRTKLIPVVCQVLANADVVLLLAEYHWTSLFTLRGFLESESGIMCLQRGAKVVINRREWLPADVLLECKKIVREPVAAELPLEGCLIGQNRLVERGRFFASVKKLAKSLLEKGQ
ncbi:MAG: hypothetical protein K2W95_31310 [Candidatus Obscuribacterales bacterium]|nr:hypothetical protein [Candidatus Obscuribacterales bacterium]